MIWLLSRLVVWPVKVGAGSMKVGYQTGRIVGYRRIFVFGLGVAVGLLLAPTTGAQLRRKLMALVDGDIANDPVPAEAPLGRDHVVDLTREVAR
jgi:hypothetical protein